jgi:hypothetical protein
MPAFFVSPYLEGLSSTSVPLLNGAAGLINCFNVNYVAFQTVKISTFSTLYAVCAASGMQRPEVWRLTGMLKELEE